MQGARCHRVKENLRQSGRLCAPGDGRGICSVGPGTSVPPPVWLPRLMQGTGWQCPWVVGGDGLTMRGGRESLLPPLRGRAWARDRDLSWDRQGHQKKSARSKFTSYFMCVRSLHTENANQRSC